jgi:hypothetical protein
MNGLNKQTRTPDWPWLPPLVADDGTLTELGVEYVRQ